MKAPWAARVRSKLLTLAESYFGPRMFRLHWRAARAFDLAGITKAGGAPFFRAVGEEPALSLSKGLESEMPASSGFDHVSTAKSNSVRRIATEGSNRPGLRTQQQIECDDVRDRPE
jgi:hypothetical protein